MQLDTTADAVARDEVRLCRFRRLRHLDDIVRAARPRQGAELHTGGPRDGCVGGGIDHQRALDCEETGLAGERGPTQPPPVGQCEGRGCVVVEADAGLAKEVFDVQCGPGGVEVDSPIRPQRRFLVVDDLAQERGRVGRGGLIEPGAQAGQALVERVRPFHGQNRSLASPRRSQGQVTGEQRTAADQDFRVFEKGNGRLHRCGIVHVCPALPNAVSDIQGSTSRVKEAPPLGVAILSLGCLGVNFPRYADIVPPSGPWGGSRSVRTVCHFTGAATPP